MIAGAVVLAASASSGAVASAVNLPERTLRGSIGINGTPPDGPSTRPSLNEGGTFLAFDSVASNLALDPNGTIRDVFVRDLEGARTRLVSVAAAGGGGDGPSYAAVIAARGGLVAFASDATNLVAGDANAATDVFAKAAFGPTLRVSAPLEGGEANGPSGEPDVSGDGTRIVFTSAATNLAPGDANGATDVFVRDLATGTLRRVSDVGGAAASGTSRAPTISPDGRYVSFSSTAADLVGRDTNGIADVFLADLDTGEVERVSVSSGEAQQNAAVIEPFPQVSDVSDDGRYVTFDSDATNLVRGDTNRDTDVFVRDRRSGRTTRVSVDSVGLQADNDSFAPRITPNGRYVAFESFATNLFPRDARREDVFLHDRRLRATTVVTATARGRKRGSERVKQLLQRPAMGDDARVVGFTSTAALTGGDGDGEEDVFVRLTAPPRGSFAAFRRVGRRLSFRLRADDPAATVFLCRVRAFITFCPRRFTTQPLQRQRSTLRVWAGGPGMLFDPTPATRRFTIP